VNAYLHIPFCDSFCSYCDFVSFAGREALLDRYAEALLREVASSDLKGPLGTVYFGGGTPSKMDPSRVSGLLRALDAQAGLGTNAEITLEANPDTLDNARLERYRTAGVTRLSLGAQTHFGTLLNLLDRRHDWAQVRDAAVAARGAGFASVSLDLMTGLPGQTVPMVEQTLHEALALPVDHLSVYSLQVEEGTPMERLVREGLELPGEDEAANHYEAVQELLEAAGFVQYEVSNWCRPGRECRHNLAVWQGGDYWGFGVSAVGTQGLVRRVNTQDLDDYLDRMERGASPEAGREVLTPRVRAFERVMTMLRTRDGVPERELDEYLSSSPSASGHLGQCLRQGWLVREEGRVRPTAAGYIRLNGILEGLMD
jgi:oxygen-independent coproporphyrinogen-3 oxidase